MKSANQFQATMVGEDNSKFESLRRWKETKHVLDSYNLLQPDNLKKEYRIKPLKQLLTH